MTLDDWRRGGTYVDYRGRRIFLQREGAGEALLLIHGFPTASWDWHRIWAPLVERFDVLAPDLIGFGFSDKPRDYAYSLMDQASLVESLLECSGIARVHVVAHDYGDTVAQELLARLADRAVSGRPGPEIRSVSLLNGGIIQGTHRPLFLQRALMSPIGGVLSRLLTRRSLRRSFARIFGPETQPGDDELESFWRLIEHGGGRRVIHRLIRYMRERERHAERWGGILRDTGVPLRLIVGALDPISGSHVAEAFRLLVRDADIVELERIGHYPQVEAPRAVLAAILEHVERSG